MFKCSWEMLFFESEDTEVFKLIEIRCLQAMKRYIMLDMLHSNMSVVCTTIVEAGESIS